MDNQAYVPWWLLLRMGSARMGGAASYTSKALSAAVIGRYDDGGMLKLTYSTAFTVSLLSWAFSQFKGGYVASGNLDFGANTVR